MSKIEKAIERLKSRPKDFTYDEMKMILNNFGFIEYNKGKTSGSRVEFRDEYGRKIVLHKPHPRNIIKSYMIRAILDNLNEWRLI